MKRKIIIVLLMIVLILIITFLTIGFANKTFLKNYYEVTNTNGEKVKIPLPLFSYYEKEYGTFTTTFKTIRSVKNIQLILNNYIENLQTCYNESCFYDADLNITISQYYIKDDFPFNKIYLTYSYGNYCENEYVLDDNWMDDIIESAKIQEIEIKKCILANNNTVCHTKTIDKADVDTLFNYVSQEKITRINNKLNISIEENETHYLITEYYTINDYNYMLSVFTDDNSYLAFKITDDNDHSKNAIYDVDQNANQILENIYNKY